MGSMAETPQTLLVTLQRLNVLAKEIKPEDPKYSAAFQNIPGLDPESEGYQAKLNKWTVAITDVALTVGLSGSYYGTAVCDIAVEQGLAERDRRGWIPPDVFSELTNRGTFLRHILMDDFGRTGMSRSFSGRKKHRGGGDR